MLGDVKRLYEYIKPLLQYVGADDDNSELNNKTAEEDIVLSMKETEKASDTKEIKNLQSEAKEYSQKEGSECNFKEESSRIAIEHNYASIDENNNIFSTVKINYNNPSSEVYNLEIEAGNKYNPGCMCCNNRINV